MYGYRMKVELDSNKTYLVTFPDIPELNTVADTQDEILEITSPLVPYVASMYFARRQKFPLPIVVTKQQVKTCEAFRLSILQVSKVYLCNELVSKSIIKADMARRLNMDRQAVDRILDLGHSTKIETMESAFQVIGCSLHIAVK